MKSIHNAIESYSVRSHVTNKPRIFNCKMQRAAFLIVLSFCNLFAASDSTKHWVGTWAASAYKVNESKNLPSKALTGNTLRQIIRVSIGGDTLRVKFSNSTCANSVSIKSVTVARSPDGTKCPVDAATIKQLKFKGDSTVTINAKSEVYSDPLAFNLTPGMRLAITIYYGDCQSSTDMTFHYGCRGNSYWTEGNKTALADFSYTAIPMWFTISSVDVLAPITAGAVVCFGNSITDGYGLTDGKQNRWTDIFSERLLANPSTEQIGVLNEGIGATNVLTASNGAASGTTRFQPDVLDQSGVRWIIIFYGVNDIGNSNSDITNNLTTAYKSMVTAAHAKNIKVYGATITPFKGYSYYDNAGNHEQIRQKINTWIRTPDNFDAYIDFDKAMRDPVDTLQYLSNYKNDGLHPNVAGYKAMGEFIDLKLFTIDTVTSGISDPLHKNELKPNIFYSFANGKMRYTFKLPCNAFVSMKVYSLSGKEIAELAGRNFSAGEHSVELTTGNLTHGTYIYSLKADDFTASGTMIFTSE